MHYPKDCSLPILISKKMPSAMLSAGNIHVYVKSVLQWLAAAVALLGTD